MNHEIDSKQAKFVSIKSIQMIWLIPESGASKPPMPNLSDTL
jgi:hypothetical protein